MGVLIKLIRTLNDSLGLTTVLVSHDVQEVLDLADYIYVLVDKKIIGHGTPTAIRKNTSAQLQQFIQGLPDGPVPFDYPSATSLEDDFLNPQAPDANQFNTHADSAQGQE